MTNEHTLTPQELAGELRESFAELRHVLDLLDPHEREQPVETGGWPAKVALAHVAFWDDFQLGRMKAALSGESRRGYPLPVHDNEARAATDAERGWDEVLATAIGARARLAAFAQDLPAEPAGQEFTEGAQTFSIGRQLQHMIRHTHEHLRPIRRFAGSMQRWRKATLRAFFDSQHRALVDGVLALPEVVIHRTPVCGIWTPRDVLAHVLSWNDNAMLLLEAWPKPDARLLEEWAHRLPMTLLNARLMEARRRLTVAEIVARLERHHAAMLAILDAATEDELSTVGDTWYGEEAKSLQFFAIAVHDREHKRETSRLGALVGRSD